MGASEVGLDGGGDNVCSSHGRGLFRHGLGRSFEEGAKRLLKLFLFSFLLVATILSLLEAHPTTYPIHYIPTL